MLSKTSAEQQSSSESKDIDNGQNVETNGMNDLLNEENVDEVNIPESTNETENGNELRRRRLERFSQDVSNADAGASGET